MERIGFQKEGIYNQGLILTENERLKEEVLDVRQKLYVATHNNNVDELKKQIFAKDKEITEDDKFDFFEDLDKLAAKFMEEIDQISAKKEKEITTI